MAACAPSANVGSEKQTENSKQESKKDKLDEKSQDSMERVKILAEHFSNMVQDGMSADLAAKFHHRLEHEPEPQGVLIAGTIAAGERNYRKAIDRYKQTLTLCDEEDKQKGPGKDPEIKQMRITCLNQMGIAFCLSNDFTEAERYFQLALEECTKDTNLIAHIVDRFSELVSVGAKLDNQSGIGRFLGSEVSSGDVEKMLQQSDGKVLTDADSEQSKDAKSEEREQRRSKCDSVEPSGGDKSEAFKERPPQQAGDTPADMSPKMSCPKGKEELLDYSTMYLQMLITGAEMAKNELRMSGGRGERRGEEEPESSV